MAPAAQTQWEQWLVLVYTGEGLLVALEPSPAAGGWRRAPMCRSSGSQTPQTLWRWRGLGLQPKRLWTPGPAEISLGRRQRAAEPPAQTPLTAPSQGKAKPSPPCSSQNTPEQPPLLAPTPSARCGQRGELPSSPPLPNQAGAHLSRPVTKQIPDALKDFQILRFVFYFF